jgi:hypothetical protein
MNVNDNVIKISAMRAASKWILIKNIARQGCGAWFGGGLMD